MCYLYETAGEGDGLVGAVDDVTPEPDELAAAVGRAVERRVQTDRTRRTRTQHAPARCLLRLRQRSLPTTTHTTHGTGSLGHRVKGSSGSSFTSGSPGHHFDPV